MTPIETLLASAVIAKTLNLPPVLTTFCFVTGYTAIKEYDNSANSLVLYCNTIGKAMYVASIAGCIVALLKP
jgi:hypothetical protein